MVSNVERAFFTRVSASREASAFSTDRRVGLVTGFFGRKTVQQSSYGSIEILKVSICLAIVTISSLSKPIRGLSTGK